MECPWHSLEDFVSQFYEFCERPNHINVPIGRNLWYFIDSHDSILRGSIYENEADPYHLTSFSLDEKRWKAFITILMWRIQGM